MALLTCELGLTVEEEGPLLGVYPP
jgi:hypothetical protein